MSSQSSFIPPTASSGIVFPPIPEMEEMNLRSPSIQLVTASRGFI